MTGHLPENLTMYSSENQTSKYHLLGQKIDAYVQTADLENCFSDMNRRKLAFRDFIIVLALSLHAVFEGLAIGLEPHSADIWILFAGKILNFVFFHNLFDIS